MSEADSGGPGDEARDIWDANAAFWDAHMGDTGNDFHRQLVAPAAERLLAVRPGETVLEIACGSGLFARRLAELGARVVATDFSRVFLERARVRVGEWAAERIEFCLMDATDSVQLMALGERRFDAAVCNMALMDMAEIEPLFGALARLLAPGPRGRFVFTLSHPCFNTTGCARMVEETDGSDGTRPRPTRSRSAGTRGWRPREASGYRASRARTGILTARSPTCSGPRFAPAGCSTVSKSRSFRNHRSARVRWTCATSAKSPCCSPPGCASLYPDPVQRSLSRAPTNGNRGPRAWRRGLHPPWFFRRTCSSSTFCRSRSRHTTRFSRGAGRGIWC
jgi:SAM-dependent methyltransferase